MPVYVKATVGPRVVGFFMATSLEKAEKTMWDNARPLQLSRVAKEPLKLEELTEEQFFGNAPLVKLAAWYLELP